MCIIQEIWKDVVGFEGYYEVSNLGRVRSVERDIFCKNGVVCHYKSRIIKQVEKTCKYKIPRLYVNLSKESRNYCKTVHRLVALAFIPNPDNLPQVNHKDEDPSNNRVDNLEWCTAQYNHDYGTRNERTSKSLLKPINVYNKNGEYICQYPSIQETAKKLKCDESSITKVCKGKNKYHHDYIFKYANQQPSL